MNISIQKILYGLLVMIGIFTFSYSSKADSNDFSVIPILPENQNKDVFSYFDLTVVPNQKQELKIKVTNNSNESVKYNIYVNTATTNQNGILDYSISEFEKDESMKLSVKECVYAEETRIELPPESSKDVTLRLSIPASPFEGIALGGITVEPVIDDKKEGISNLFTRTLALQLSESKENIVPKLEGGAVLVSQENLRNNVKFELRNTTPVIIPKVKAEITILKQGSKTPIVEETKEQLSFAPNSKFGLMTEWKQQFDPGNYTYNINLKDEKGHSWKFTKEFEIKDEVAKDLNEKSVDVKDNTIWIYLIIPFILLVVALLSMLYILIKKKMSK